MKNQIVRRRAIVYQILPKYRTTSLGLESQFPFLAINYFAPSAILGFPIKRYEWELRATIFTIVIKKGEDGRDALIELGITL